MSSQPNVARARAPLLALALLLAACGTAESPSADASAAVPSTAPSATAPAGDASNEASASAAPSVQEPAVSDIDAYGLVATVSADDLRVRTWPGTEVSDSLLTTLSAGDEVVLENGPIDLDGFRWYLARFEPRPASAFEGEVDSGWIATGPVEDDDRFVQQQGIKCPVDMTVHALARMGPPAFEACGVELDTVSGVVETCYEGPLSPFTYEPGWAWFSCLSLRTEEQAAWSYQFFLPPDYDGPELERGDVVTLSGRVGVDQAAYGPCEVATSEVEGEATLEAVTRIWELDCQYRFVVESAEVTDHIELPPLF